MPLSRPSFFPTPWMTSGSVGLRAMELALAPTAPVIELLTRFLYPCKNKRKYEGDEAHLTPEKADSFYRLRWKLFSWEGDVSVEGYKKISEAMVSRIERLKDTAGKRARASFVSNLDSLEKKLLSNHFHIVVMGQFKRGKTTFINSLLGEEVLPSSVVPLTSINTVLRYGPEQKAEIHYMDGRVEGGRIEELERYVTEKGNPENRLGITRVEVFYPSAYLRDGLCIVDTPGTGSTYLHNDEMAFSYLSHADAVIFMLSADPPISRTELEFLRQIRGFVRKIFFVQNKIDYLDPREREESLRFNTGVIADSMGLDSVEIFQLSAKQALAARQANDPGSLGESKQLFFESRLDDFLMKEKGIVFLDSVTRNLHKALTEMIASVELERSLLTRPIEELQEKVNLFRQQMMLIQREREEILFLLQGDFNQLVKDGLDRDVEDFKREAIDLLVLEFEALVEQGKTYSGFALAEKVDDFVQNAIRGYFTDWRIKEEERLALEFKKMEEMYRGKANTIANRILEIAEDLFEIELFTIDAGFDLSEEVEFWFKMGDPSYNLIDFFRGSLSRALPKKISHRILKKQKREELLTLFDRHCGRVRYDFFLRLQKSTNMLRSGITGLIDDTMEAIDGAIGRAARKREESEGDLTSSITMLDVEKARLEVELEELTRLKEEVQRRAEAGGA